METKICTKCKVEKTISEFYRRKISKDGLRSQCKACDKSAFEAWRVNNPEKYKSSNRESIRKYYNTDKGRLAMLNNTKKWKENNMGRYLEYQKKWRSDVSKDIKLDNTMEQYFEYLNSIEEQND